MRSRFNNLVSTYLDQSNRKVFLVPNGMRRIQKLLRCPPYYVRSGVAVFTAEEITRQADATEENLTNVQNMITRIYDER